MKTSRQLLTAAAACLALAGTAYAAEHRPPAPIAPEVLRQFDEKDSGRYIVVFDDRADLGAAKQVRGRGPRRTAAAAALRARAERSQGEARRFLAAARAAGAVTRFRPYWIVNAIAVESRRSVLRVLATRPGVREILPDREVRLVRPSSQQQAATASTVDWNIERVGAAAAWEAGIDGSGVVVANIDTGVDHLHPSLAAKYRGADGNHDYDWWDEAGGSTSPSDCHGHGTHTMGTMVGGDGPGPDPDDIGVAPGATWIAARLFGCGGESTTTGSTLSAVEWVTAPTRLDGSDPRPDLGPDVVSNSWGFLLTCSPFFDEVLENWRAFGILGVWAAGNSGPEPATVMVPADSPLAFSVGATDPDDQVAWFSSRGPSCYGEVKPEVSAPGVFVRSAFPGGGFAYDSGTSMATPHVAGAAALVLAAAGGTLGIDEVEELLRASALDRGAPGPDNDYGAGRLQAGQAALLALRGGVLEGTVRSADGQPTLGASLTMLGQQTFTLGVGADGAYRARLPVGDYAVTAQAFGYAPRSASVTIVQDLTTRLDFVLDPLPRLSLRGQVTEYPGGRPLAGVRVSAVGTPVPSALTDAAGAYELSLPPGTYTLSAIGDRCHHTASASVELSSSQDQDLTLDVRIDAFGYTCALVEHVEEAGQQRLPLVGDDVTAEVALPFTASFYGRPYTSVLVHSNGFVTFVPSPPEFFNRALPNPARPNGAVYALWDDLIVPDDPEAGVFTATVGTAPHRRFVIEYRNVRFFEGSGVLSFSVVIGEDGTVEVRHTRLTGSGDGRSATVGIEDEAGLSALQYSFNQAVLSAGTGVRFLPGPVAVVTGRVARGGDGRPIPAARVSAGGFTTRTRADGTYRLALLPGTHALMAEADGFEPGPPVSITAAVGDHFELDFALDAPGLALAPAALSLSGACQTVQASVEARSVGTRPVQYDSFLLGRLRPIVQDAVGDSRSIVDIASIAARTDSGFLTLAVTFAPGQDMESLYAYVLLDTDQHPSSGLPAPRQALGAEYIVDLTFAPFFGSVFVTDAAGGFVADLPASIDGTTVEFGAPLDLLGDDGNLDLAVVAPFPEPRPWDSAPDASHVTLDAAGDYFWLTLEGAHGTLPPGETGGLLVQADPVPAAPGTYEADLLVFSNDPLEPFTVLPVTVDVLPHVTTPSGQCVVSR